tara:strand:- start:867 stop:1166 length:300 start_codon:yes stop_codon:yes gene_type:complete
MTQTNKIAATKIEVGMKIQFHSLKSWPTHLTKTTKFGIITHSGVKKSSPILTVTSVSQPIIKERYRTQYKTLNSSEIHITFAEVDGVCDINTKQKVVLR